MICFLLGHRPALLPGLFYVVCRRCPKVMRMTGEGPK